jgi:type I restriction-modification system DNA methylase subunit
MNMVIRGMDFDFGKEPANTFSRDLHPDLRADFIMDNPPFNIKEWKDGVRDDDPRWKYGVTIEKIKKKDCVLTPGRYVGAPPQEDDGEPFEDKMARLTATLKEQFA